MEETGKRTDRISQGMRSRFQDMRGDIAPLDIDDGLVADTSDSGGISGGFLQASVDETVPDDVVKIRDAATDKTIVSVTEAQSVRNAANRLQMDDDPDDIVKIRDAATDKTIVSVTEAQSVRDAANRLMTDGDPDDILKIRDAMTDKTIVSVTEARSVRDAVRQMDWRESLPSDDALEGLVIPKEPEPFVYEEEEEPDFYENRNDLYEPEYEESYDDPGDDRYDDRYGHEDSYDRRAVRNTREPYERRDTRRSRQRRESDYGRYDDYNNDYYIRQEHHPPG